MATLEIAAIKLSARASIKSVQEILERLTKLEQSLQSPHSAPRHADDEPYAQIKKTEQASVKTNDDITLDELKASWNEIIDEIAKKKMSAATYAREAAPLELGQGLLTLGFTKERAFYKESLEKNGNKELLEQVLTERFGVKFRLKFTTVAATQQAAAGEEKRGEMQDAEPPIVKSVLNIFGGKITRRSPGVT